MVAAVLDAFPSTHVVINAMTPRFVLTALETSPRIGLRVDCLGEFDMFSTLATSPVMQERWKTAPILSEWCGTSTTSTTLGAQQVRDYHISMTSSGNLKVGYDEMTAGQQSGFLDAARSAGYRYEVRRVTVPKRVSGHDRFTVLSHWRNAGSAPTYDNWDVVLRAHDKAGRVVATRPLDIDLGELLPGRETYRSSVRLPPLKTGTYRLSLAVTDPETYLDPMSLAITGRRADGGYEIGRLRITR
ncbi:MAG: DUF4832 domain-containing protein [Nocardioides sp.]